MHFALIYQKIQSGHNFAKYDLERGAKFKVYLIMQKVSTIF